MLGVFLVSLCLGFFATFFEKKGGAKKLSIGKFFMVYILRSGFISKKSELYFLMQNVISCKKHLI